MVTHEQIAKDALRLEWKNVESQARSVSYWAEDQINVCLANMKAAEDVIKLLTAKVEEQREVIKQLREK